MTYLVPVECQKAPRSNPERWDRFSNLPEAIIHHIFSFLDVKDIARIGILSKRCRQMFVSSPYLMLKSTSCSDGDSKCKQFSDHVDTFLDLRNGLEIRSLLLKWECHNDNCYVEMNYAHKWIDIAVSCQVQELDLEIGASRHCENELKVGTSQQQNLDFEHGEREDADHLHLDLVFGEGEDADADDFDFEEAEDENLERKFGIREDTVFDVPQCIFNSNFLRVLNLNMTGHRLKKPDGVLVSLEELSLETLVVNGNTLKEWISKACPSLKKLTLKDLYEIKKLSIINPCLEILTLVGLSYCLCAIDISAERLQKLSVDLNSIFPGYTCKMKIDAPSLTDLTWEAMSPNNIYLSEFKYLQNAAIFMGVHDDYVPEVTVRNRLAALLQGLRHARVLQINIEVLEVLFLHNLHSVVFDNLRHLVVNVDGLKNCQFAVLASFLMGCLNVEKLSFKCLECLFQPDYIHKLRRRASKFCKQHQDFQDLICHQLKEIEVELKGKGHQVELVGNLLKIATGLKKVTVVHSRENAKLLSKIGLQQSRAKSLPFEVNLVEKEFPIKDLLLFSMGLE